MFSQSVCSLFLRNTESRETIEINQTETKESMQAKVLATAKKG